MKISRRGLSGASPWRDNFDASISHAEVSARAKCSGRIVEVPDLIVNRIVFAQASASTFEQRTAALSPPCSILAPENSAAPWKFANWSSASRCFKHQMDIPFYTTPRSPPPTQLASNNAHAVPSMRIVPDRFSSAGSKMALLRVSARIRASRRGGCLAGNQGRQTHFLQLRARRQPGVGGPV